MKQRATRRNSLLGRLFGSKTTYRRTRTPGGGQSRRAAATESPRAAREREAERLHKKFSDAQLDRKLKAHYAKGGSLREFMAMNPGYKVPRARKRATTPEELRQVEAQKAYTARLFRGPLAASELRGAKRNAAARFSVKVTRRMPQGSWASIFRDGVFVTEIGPLADYRGPQTGKLRQRGDDLAAIHAARQRVAELKQLDRPNPRGKRNAAALAVHGQARAVPKRKRNPASAAAEVYEEFHGTPSTSVLEVRDRVHTHEHLAELGKLELLVVNGIDGYEHRISGFKGARLCSSETKDQLFIRGGDQKVDLGDYGIKPPHEIETLGQVTEIQYFTTKTHLGSEGGTAIYFHKAGTTSSNGRHKKVGYGPDLIYRVRDKALEFSGGTYEIRAEGIDK
jgi:hypothetical protein